MQIERGEHIYNFQFRLPAGLPSSFEGEFGHIRYIATVVLDIPRWPDDVFQQPFTVIKPLDLNGDPELRVIIHITFSLQSETIAQKNMCFFFLLYRIRLRLEKTICIIHAFYCVVFHRIHYRCSPKYPLAAMLPVKL